MHPKEVCSTEKLDRSASCSRHPCWDYECPANNRKVRPTTQGNPRQSAEATSFNSPNLSTHLLFWHGLCRQQRALLCQLLDAFVQRCQLGFGLKFQLHQLCISSLAFLLEEKNTNELCLKSQCCPTLKAPLIKAAVLSASLFAQTPLTTNAN